MARGSVEVTYKPADAARLPDILTEGAALLMALRQRGTLKSVGERLRIRRQGGYSALDVWVLLLVFFTTGASRGVRALWEVLHPHAEELAAVAGRRRLPSPASLSRALDAVEVELLRGSSTWLLAGVSEVDEVLRHPAVQTYDARGDGWHVFDIDPTVTTLRHRALPTSEDLPEPRRRSEDTGAPGYSGRKRGDIQLRRVTAQHTGSSVWIHGHLSAGNGEGVVDFERALDSIVETCERLEHPLSRTQVRMDGEYGNVPWFTACRERKLPFITRLNRPALYDDPEVLARLRQATWHLVADSGSGPQRSAADLGILTVRPDSKTKRPDGSSYEPITVRVVACIFPKTGKAKRGRTIDGWQIELFAVDLPADAWPAPEAITAYFARNSLENRFAQEDRELGLDRIVSYHLPGQELATLVGLSLWNLRLARGFALEPPPAERPIQQLRRAQVDDRVPEHWPRDPLILKALAELDWTTLLVNWPGWSWDAASGELRCLDDRALSLTTVRPGEHTKGRTTIIFRRPTGGCDNCPPRGDCLRSDRPRAAKHAEFSVPTESADKLRTRLVRLRRHRPPAIAPITDAPGPTAVVDSLFLPAVARQAFERCFLRSSMRIKVELPPPEPPRPRLVAADVADRQRRRKTWEQNLKRYALPERARVRVEVEGAPALRVMLGERVPPPAQCGQAG
jgi:hypothetical protein